MFFIANKQLATVSDKHVSICGDAMLARGRLTLAQHHESISPGAMKFSAPDHLFQSAYSREQQTLDLCFSVSVQVSKERSVSD